MNIGIHIETNILSCMFCLLLFGQQRKHKVFDFLGTTAFNSLLWASIFIMILDSISWFMMANILPHTDQHLMLVQSLYYFVQCLLPLYFMIYCYNTSGRSIHKLSWPIIYAAVIFTGVILVNNYFSGFAFYVKDNSVVRGDGFWMAIFGAMLYITTSMILCTVFFVLSFKSSFEKQRIAFHMFICVGMSFIGAIVCSFVNFVSPWHIFIASLIYLYMCLHGYRERTLDALAYTDSLTGLKNHAMYSLIKQKMNDKIKANPSVRFAVAVMDVNDLKKTNDCFGHKAGDALIISASHLMCNIFQHSPVCRIGGDEFVAILENSDFENREELCVQFMDAMRKATFFAEDQELPLSVALGIEVYSQEQHATFEEVFHAADEAMYENKALAKKIRTA